CSNGTSDLQFYLADHMLRTLASPGVDAAHFCQGVHAAWAVGVHHALNHPGNRRKSEASGQEFLDDYLVRGVQNDGKTLLALKRAIGETQARKPLSIRGFKLQLRDVRQIQWRKRARPPLWVRERVLDRQLHVRLAELRDDRAIHELNHRMHNRLGVDH